MKTLIRSVTITLLAIAVAASAATRRVPVEYPSIQTAIQDSADGDTVIVSPGVYYETINFGGRDIVVTGTDPNDPAIVGYTIINAEEDGSAVTFENGETNAAVLTGFTITGGVGTVNNQIEGGGTYNVFWGAGIYCLHASPTITKNIIAGNHALTRLDVANVQDRQLSYGGGMACIECSPVITHNIFRNNSAYVAGGLITYIGDPVISNNMVFSNSAALGGGVILIGGTFYNNTVVGNNCDLDLQEAQGGNLYVVSDLMLGCAHVFNNIFCNARSGGGVVFQGTVPPDRFTFNNVWGNLPGNYVTMDPQTGQARYDDDERTGKMGNISADPMFPNTFSADYHLTLDSPCINAGDPDTTQQWNRTDIDDQPRVYAFRIDIGADEYVGYVKPVAHAGADRHILAPQQSITLDGSGSYFYDPCGVREFRWTQVEGAPVVLDDANCPTPTFIPEALGRYVFELAVTDDQYTGQTDQVLVLVAENTPPVAHAGADRVWSVPGEVVLDGTGSSDPDLVDQLRYTWRQVEGPAVDLRDADTTTPSFSCDTHGQYIFELVVNDGFADSEPSRSTHVAVNVTRDLQPKSFMPPTTEAMYYPDVSGTKLVYVGGSGLNAWRILCRDLTTGTTETFPGTGINIVPKIDGDLVVWAGGALFEQAYGPECTSVIVRDIANGVQKELRTRTTSSSYGYPDISGNKVVWVQHLDINRSDPGRWYDMPYDICGADVSDLQKPVFFTVATRVGNCDPFPLDNLTNSRGFLAVSNDIVVWEGQGDIFAADISDISNIRVVTVCDHPARQHNPAISGRFVVWTDERDDGGDIYGADLSDLDNIREMEIAKRPGIQQQPAIDGRLIAYVEGSGAIGSIRLACITRQYGVLDTDLPQNPVGTSPVLDGVTLVLQWFGTTTRHFSLNFGYSIFDGPVQNLGSGMRYDYIQHAVSTARHGDEIVVGQGLYPERIDFVGKALTIRSSDPSDPAVVAATVVEYPGDIVMFVREDASSVLDGLTLMGGRTGVVCSGASPTIMRCAITANSGPGIRLLNQSNPQIIRCTITANGGAGVEMWTPRVGRFIQHNQATFRNCLIAGNRLQGIHDGRIVVANCTVVENLGPGIDSVAPTVVNSIVFSNHREGNGTQITGSYGAITYCDIESGWPGEGNIDADPLFVEPGRWMNIAHPGVDQPPPPGIMWVAGDYHLKSRGLRWDGTSGSWISDDATSPCIDTGDPSSTLQDEPLAAPDGAGGQEYVNLRIDMGAYGGTAEASLAPPVN